MSTTVQTKKIFFSTTSTRRSRYEIFDRLTPRLSLIKLDHGYYCNQILLVPLYTQSFTKTLVYCIIYRFYRFNVGLSALRPLVWEIDLRRAKILLNNQVRSNIFLQCLSTRISRKVVLSPLPTSSSTCTLVYIPTTTVA